MLGFPSKEKKDDWSSNVNNVDNKWAVLQNRKQQIIINAPIKYQVVLE